MRLNSSTAPAKDNAISPPLSVSASDRDKRRLDLARWMIRNRLQRSPTLAFLDLGEPTWDMALDLYVAEGEKRNVDVSGLCIASQAPTSTAVRHIKSLLDTGHFVSSADPADARRKLIKLSYDVRSRLNRWLDDADDALAKSSWRRPE